MRKQILNQSESTFLKKKPIIEPFFCFLLLLCMVSGCSQVDTRDDKPQYYPPQEQTKPPEEQIPETSPPIVEDATKATAPPSQRIPDVEIGLLFTRQDRDSINSIMNKALEYSINHIELGGELIHTVDELILNPAKRSVVEDIVRQAEGLGISSYIRSQELNLEGRSFQFNLIAPLAVARQTAYREVLKSIPEIDGIVLSFDHAQLKPWEAIVLPGQPPLSPQERIQFVIDMIRSVVVDECNRRLMIRVTPASESFPWLTEVLESYPEEKISVITPVPLIETNPLQPWQFDLYATESHPTLLEIDLNAANLGGTRFLNCIGEELLQILQNARSRNITGMVGEINAENFAVLNTPLKINLFILSKILSQPQIPQDLVWDEAIQRIYGVFPASEEGRILQKILRNSSFWWRRANMAKGIPLFSYRGNLLENKDFLSPLESLEKDPKNPGVQFILDELKNPRKQTLVDLAQEAFEAKSWFEQSATELKHLSTALNPSDFDWLQQRLEHQRLLTDLLFYIKQCYWGFELWKQTKDENEVLHLEANLQHLEQKAKQLTQQSDSTYAVFYAKRIQDFTANIRAEFPRVILGWKDRKWNRLRNISIEQVGPEAVEIRWTSEHPSYARLFVSTTPLVFELTKSAETNMPAQEHKIRLEGLQAEKQYLLRVQCSSPEKETTNSGVYIFQLEPSTLL